MNEDYWLQGFRPTGAKQRAQWPGAVELDWDTIARREFPWPHSKVQHSPRLGVMFVPYEFLNPLTQEHFPEGAYVLDDGGGPVCHVATIEEVDTILKLVAWNGMQWLRRKIRVRRKKLELEDQTEPEPQGETQRD